MTKIRRNRHGKKSDRITITTGNSTESPLRQEYRQDNYYDRKVDRIPVTAGIQSG